MLDTQRVWVCTGGAGGGEAERSAPACLPPPRATVLGPPQHSEVVPPPIAVSAPLATLYAVHGMCGGDLRASALRSIAAHQACCAAGCGHCGGTTCANEPAAGGPNDGDGGGRGGARGCALPQVFTPISRPWRGVCLHCFGKTTCLRNKSKHKRRKPWAVAPRPGRPPVTRRTQARGPGGVLHLRNHARQPLVQRPCRAVAHRAAATDGGKGMREDGSQAALH